MMRFQGVTRRAVFKVGGGLAAVALGLNANATGSQRLAAAQEASPVASPSSGSGLEGRYVAIRMRTLTGAHPTADVLATIEEGFMPLLEAIPGFVAYLGTADPSSREAAFVSVFDDKAGADESTRLGAAWLRDNEYDFFAGEAIVIEGAIGVAAGSFMGDGLVRGYVAIRSRELKPDHSGVELLEMIREGFVPLLESAPGFIAYLAVANEETRAQFSIGVYETEAGAVESTRLAAAWGERGAADFVEGDPVVIEGQVALAAASNEP